MGAVTWSSIFIQSRICQAFDLPSQAKQRALKSGECNWTLLPSQTNHIWPPAGQAVLAMRAVELRVCLSRLASECRLISQPSLQLDEQSAYLPATARTAPSSHLCLHSCCPGCRTRLG